MRNPFFSPGWPPPPARTGSRFGRGGRLGRLLAGVPPCCRRSPAPTPRPPSSALARFRMDPRDAQRRMAQNLAGGLVAGVGPWAAYALAADAARRGAADEAFDWGAVAFAQADSHDLFLRSGCLLDALAQRYPERMATRGALESHWLQTCRPLWSGTASRPNVMRAGDGPWAQPGRWIVIFYRRQISPALGAIVPRPELLGVLPCKPAGRPACWDSPSPPTASCASRR